MARYYQMFRTQEERKAWETEQKKKDTKFRVCMRMTAEQLKKDLNIGFILKIIKQNKLKLCLKLKDMFGIIS